MDTRSVIAGGNGTRSQDLVFTTPVCEKICLLPECDYNWFAEGDYLESAWGIGSSYSVLAKSKVMDIMFGLRLK